MSDASKPRDLKEDCIAEAIAIIASDGVEKLSLREVARRLGVSHQAPYKHFSSRDHILAEVVARAFADFARHLDASLDRRHAEGGPCAPGAREPSAGEPSAGDPSTREPGAREPGAPDRAARERGDPERGDPEREMGGMGYAYLNYAKQRPLEYRLMFGTPLPNAEDHPEMMRQAKHAFSLLKDALKRKAEQRGRAPSAETITLDALFIWSGLHGLSSILASSAVSTLDLDEELLSAGPEHMLKRFGQALAAEE